MISEKEGVPEQSPEVKDVETGPEQLEGTHVVGEESPEVNAAKAVGAMAIRNTTKAIKMAETYRWEYEE